MNVTVRAPDELAARLGPKAATRPRAVRAGDLGAGEFRAGHLSEAERQRAFGCEVLNGKDGAQTARGVFE